MNSVQLWWPTQKLQSTRFDQWFNGQHYWTYWIGIGRGEEGREEEEEEEEEEAAATDPEAAEEEAEEEEKEEKEDVWYKEDGSYYMYLRKWDRNDDGREGLDMFFIYKTIDI